MTDKIEQEINGDGNDQSINKMENSNNNLTYITNINGITNIDEFIQVCDLCLSAKAPLIIEKAANVATERVKYLIDQLKEILRDKDVETNKLNDLTSDPKFIYFLKDIQTSTIKSRDKSEIKTLAELIAMRLMAENSSMLELSLEESAEVIPKLLPIHFKMLGMMYIIKLVHFYRRDIDDVLNTYEEFIDQFKEIQDEHKESILLHLESMKCAIISSIKYNSNLVNFLYSEYYEHVNNGVLCSDIPEELKIIMHKYNLNFIVKPNNNQKHLIDVREFNKIKKNISSDDLNVLNHFLDDNISKEKFISDIRARHPRFCAFSDWWEQSSFSSMTLTNLGTTIAIAFLNSTTDNTFQYTNWI